MNSTDNQGGAPNYYPNSFGGPEPSHIAHKLQNTQQPVGGVINRYETPDEDNFSQATVFYRQVLDQPARQRLVDNIVGHLKNASPFIQERAVKNFAQVDADFGRLLNEGLKLQRSAKM